MSTLDTRVRDALDQAIIERADVLARQMAPSVAQHDRDGRFAHDHLALLRADGALALTLPTALGGEGFSLSRTLLWQTQLGRVAPATALCLGWHLMALGCLSHTASWPAEAFARLAHDVVHKGHLINILVTERDHGNLMRGAAPGTVARRSAQGWVLQGRKAYCSSAPALAQMVVYARIEGEASYGEFLVPRGEGVHIIDTWDTAGMRATESHDIELRNVWVPDSALVHRYGPGPDRPSSFSIGSRAWGLQLPALYLGIAEAARDEALAFARNYRAASLGGQAVIDAPAVQAKLGEIAFLLTSARSQLYGVAEHWERNPHLQEHLGDAVAVAKVAVGRCATQVVQLAVEIVGGQALSRQHPLERMLRDVQCHRFNPPQADAVLSGLARSLTAATDEAHSPVHAAPSTAPSIRPFATLAQAALATAA